MDSEELHYVTYDPDAIWEEMQTAYVAAGGDPLYPGDEKEMLLRSVQADIVSVFAGVDNALRMQTLRYATGDYLDILGESRGCERQEATPATGHVQFTYTAASGSDASYRTIAAGTLLTVDGTVTYALDQELTMGTGAGTMTGTYTCTQSGQVGNGLTSGETMVLVDGTNPFISAIETIYDGSTGGRDEETDDDYRERLRLFMASALAVGTKDQYEQAVLSYDDRITQAYARLNGSAAEVDIICEDTDTESTIAAAAAADLAENGLAPLGYSVTVLPATAKTYTLALTITTSLTDDQVQDVIDEFTAWQNNILGQAFCPEKLVGMLYAAGCTSVVIGSGSAFDGGAAKYTAISAWERCQGTVSWS